MMNYCVVEQSPPSILVIYRIDLHLGEEGSMLIFDWVVVVFTRRLE